LLQMSCGEAGPVPVGASARARELPELPRSARLHQRLPAEGLAAASLPAVSRQSDRTSGQSAKSELCLCIQSRVSELPLAAPRFEQPIGVPVPPLRDEHRARRKNDEDRVGRFGEYEKPEEPRNHEATSSKGDRQA